MNIKWDSGANRQLLVIVDSSNFKKYIIQILGKITKIKKGDEKLWQKI